MKLDEEGVGRIYCLAGIGTPFDGMVESARGAKRIVALDDCIVAYARETIEHAGLPSSPTWYASLRKGLRRTTSPRRLRKKLT